MATHKTCGLDHWPLTPCPPPPPPPAPLLVQRCALLAEMAAGDAEAGAS